MNGQPRKQFFTIGHSDRSIADFAELLQDAGVVKVVDIRKVPRSRSNPQFNKETLPGALGPFGITYVHVEALGGLRGKGTRIPPELNAFWTNDSFHNYADYALTPEFRAGFERLCAEGEERRSAIMCAEAVWWRCHRRIVSDYLLARGNEVFHIMGAGRLEPARLTEGAVVQRNGTIVYPLADAPS